MAGGRDEVYVPGRETRDFLEMEDDQHFMAMRNMLTRCEPEQAPSQEVSVSMQSLQVGETACEVILGLKS